MGWPVSISLFIMYLIMKEDVMLLASSLFAIAGSLGTIASYINKNK